MRHTNFALGALAVMTVACTAPVLDSVRERGDRSGEEGAEPDGEVAAPAGPVSTVAAGAVSTKQAPPSPDTLKAFVGGTSIALRWNERGSPGVAEHKVIRDGNVVASVKPGFHTDFPELYGNGFIDTAVTPGTTYAYQVQAIGENGMASAPSKALNVTHPTTSTQPPNIIVDTSRAPDLDDWMQNTVKPFLSIWYPKIVELVARPDYTPASTITLRLDADFIAYTKASEAISGMEPKWARERQRDALGAWLHEATHIIQNYGPNVPGWIAEGVPDWARDAVLHDRDLPPARPGKGLNYFGQHYLNWMQTRYSPNLVHAVNVNAHTKYNEAVFQQVTGKSLGALVQEHDAAAWRWGPVRFSGSRCLDGDVGAKRAEVAACKDGVEAQRWTSVASEYGWILLVAPNDGCVDVQQGNKDKGAHIWTFACNSQGAQRWVVTADKKLMQPQAGRCLAIAADGSSLELQDCDNPAVPSVTLP